MKLFTNLLFVYTVFSFFFINNYIIKVAFFGGDDVEHEVCNGRLNELKEHVSSTQLQTWRFNIFNNFDNYRPTHININIPLRDG